MWRAERIKEGEDKKRSLLGSLALLAFYVAGKGGGEWERGEGEGGGISGTYADWWKKGRNNVGWLPSLRLTGVGLEFEKGGGLLHAFAKKMCGGFFVVVATPH